MQRSQNSFHSNSFESNINSDEEGIGKIQETKNSANHHFDTNSIAKFK